MTKQQLSEAVRIAQSDVELPQFLGEKSDQELIDLFDGFGLPTFQPVVCTVKQLAALVRYQCVMYNGDVSATALNEIYRHGRRKFQVVG